MAAVGQPALRREKDEDDARRLALQGDAGFVAYQRRWETKLGRLTRRYPERLRVPGLSTGEVRDMLVLRLLELVRTKDLSPLELARPGTEWGLTVVNQHLRELRKQFRMVTESADFREPVRVLGCQLNQEEIFFELEAEHGRRLAQHRVESNLTRPQRTWLSALKLSANSGDFFAGGERLNLSAASRLLGERPLIGAASLSRTTEPISARTPQAPLRTQRTGDGASGRRWAA